MPKPLALHPGWIAGGIFVLVLLWLLSGLGEPAQESASPAGVAQASPAVKVRVRDSVAEARIREVRLSARTAPLRAAVLRAETSGRVESIEAARGQSLAAGAVILRLAPRDRPQQLQRAQAVLAQRELEFSAGQRLHKQQLLSDLDLAAARANLETARAEVARLRDDLEHTVVRAPFAGILETRAPELGDYLAAGDELGRLIQMTPFVVRAQVTEDVIGLLEIGQPARAILADDSEVEGVLHYLAREADAATRTFPVELLINAPTLAPAAGRSAVVILPLEQLQVHVLKPDILSLDERGEFGVKSVNARNQVVFHPASIVHGGQEEVWLSGLPERLRLITRGQGFVSAGDEVDAVTGP